jgi:hypothetical protein
MEEALKHSDRENLFPRYIKDGKCKADPASATINKWIKKDFNGLTAHCIRHTFKDRLRAVVCPMDMIDQIGVWRSVSSICSNYGQGYSIENITFQLRKLKNNFCKDKKCDKHDED